MRKWEKLTKEAWAAATSRVPWKWGGGEGLHPDTPAIKRPSQERGRGWRREALSAQAWLLKGRPPRPPTCPQSPLAGQFWARRVPPCWLAGWLAHLAGIGRAGLGGQPGQERVVCLQPLPLPSPLLALPPSCCLAGGSSCVPLAALADPQPPRTSPSSPTRSGRQSRQSRQAGREPGQHSAPRAQDLGRCGPEDSQK